MAITEASAYLSQEKSGFQKAYEILATSLSPEITISTQINDGNNLNMQARYTGAAVEALSVYCDQEGVNFVIEFFTDASLAFFERTDQVDRAMLLTVHDLALRYIPSERISKKLLVHELNAGWMTHANQIEDILLNRQTIFLHH
jgi:hypothetical protein